MALGGAELLILFILFILFMGGIAAIVIVIVKLTQRSNSRGASTTSTINIDPSIHAALTEIAARDGVPVSSVANGVLNDYINKRRYWPPTQ